MICDFDDGWQARQGDSNKFHELSGSAIEVNVAHHRQKEISFSVPEKHAALVQLHRWCACPVLCMCRPVMLYPTSRAGSTVVATPYNQLI